MTYDLSIQSPEPAALFDVRGDADSMRSLFGAMKLAYPLSPDTMICENSVDVIRIGRKRCLVRVLRDQELVFETEFKQHSNLIFVNVTCVSDMYHAFRLVGQDVLRVLAQLTPLNLYRFPIGAATATEIFAMGGFLVHEGELDYVVYVEASYADYVLERLHKCALL